MTRSEILAMPAGRELDRLIAALLGDREDPGDNWWHSPDGGKYSAADGGPWPCSTEIDAAWRVVDALSDKDYGLALEDWRISPGAPGQWGVMFYLPDGHDTGQATGESAPLAICRAALLALKGDDA